MAGIYVHIPFCKKACHYCNFHFSTSTKLQGAFVLAVVKEITLQENYLNQAVATIYFGGGTPSLLPAKDLETIIKAINQIFLVKTSAEITLETNPDDISIDNLLHWKKIGINRLSIGVQSFFNNDLTWMNRAHNAEQALQSIHLAKKCGFENITIDLIYGTPTLTDQAWQQNVELAINSGVQHLSCYALTVEPKTALHKMIGQKTMENIDPDKQARHFEILMERTSAAGFEHYEISNFALKGYRSQHNSSYWQSKHYLGLGPSAHSFNGESRQWNVASNALYISSLHKNILPFEKEILTPQHRLNEYIMTSLRTIEGIQLPTIRQSFGESAFEKLLHDAASFLASNTLEKNGETLRLTSKGKFLADGIASDLFQL